MKINDIDLLTDTPFVSLDLEIMDRNINWLQDLANESNVKIRPHTKTHKSPYIAHQQLKAGANGITTAKLGEAEIMSNAGIDEILIAFPLIGRKKLERFSDLLKRANLTVALDDIKVAQGLNEVGEIHKKKIPVYIDVDTGLNRMGKSSEESVKSILEISTLPYIEIKGLMSHTGHAYAEKDEEGIRKVAINDATILQNTKLSLEKEGLYIQEISVGATATARFIKEIPFITEVRAGMYVFNDRMVMGTGGANEESCAITVFATIVSHPDSGRFIIDAGSKTLAQDSYKGGGHGYIKNHENLVIKSLSEEHGIIEIQGKTNLGIGDVIEIIPNHVCPVVNLADQILGFRNGELERIIPIKGRGKNK
ncbi:alanine racemase [Virgibacillus doumboii]|uniref:alanine racemase n=1 Tax=Virgibacillus doumboii TaxID=2697503 RepID=UPI0013E03715|nr:alanine racemase [Virgibacillus doumboii]